MNSTLSYLYPLPPGGKVELDQLLRIKAEREKWPNQGDDFLQNLPFARTDGTSFTCDYSQDIVRIGKENELSPVDREMLNDILKQLIPWRKGPFDLFGIDLDAEWKCQLKWNRIRPHLENLKGKTVLDIGCNNGHYMFRMADMGPKLVLGIDPVVHNFRQFKLLQHFARSPNLHFELFEVAHLPHFSQYFDTIFSMGIIYHHRNPIEQLQWIHEALRPGGQLILESLAIPGSDSICLFPQDRYAKMRNVWFLPTASCLENWLKRTHFTDIKLISVIPASAEEQRITPWCPPPRESFEHFLDPTDPFKTVEGHPAPLRVAVSARKKR